MATKTTRRNARDNPAGLKDPLILIDTNILLDFYRARNEQGLALLKRLDEIHDRAVVSYQIEMEFKKNRQRAILESLKELNISGQITTPAYLKDHRSAKSARKDFDSAREKIGKVKSTLQKAMAEPNTHDEVYKQVQRLFNCKSLSNLSRDNELKYKMRRLALRRFMLGYPPRKNNDTSIGDAVNWEWSIHCAAANKQDLVIVSRDSDFGIVYGKDAFINDWLSQEFKQRVSAHGRVRLTQRLSQGLEWLELAVSPEEKSGEDSILEEASQHPRQSSNSSNQQVDLSKLLKALNISTDDTEDDYVDSDTTD